MAGRTYEAKTQKCRTPSCIREIPIWKNKQYNLVHCGTCARRRREQGLKITYLGGNDYNEIKPF